VTETERIPVAITIAGSDSGGGAGIQADLKAFAANGVHGTSAITAITVQNTVGVDAVHQVPPEIVVGQVRVVAEDIGIDAVKIGMLGDTETIGAVVEALSHVGDAPVVFDPVMVAESGAALLDPGAREALVARLLPLATVATPNLLEARELSGLGDEASQEELARAVQALGPDAVVVTGGHTADGADLLYEAGHDPVRIEGPRHPGGASHGSGCTHSSTLAAQLARGAGVEDAAREAKRVTSEAVRRGLRGIGAGAGPVDVLGLSQPASRKPLP
jgi:hydroxymethylpyrimidine/phosphomethylpyrimidine kinase